MKSTFKVLQKKVLALWYQIRIGNWSTLEVMFDDRGEWRGGMLQFRVALGLGWKTSKILIYICLIPSLNTQSCINGLMVVQDFYFWTVCVAGLELKKMGPIMSNFWERFFHVFRGKKKYYFLSALKMLHKMKVRKLEKNFLKKITMELWAKNIHIQFYLALLETPLRATYDFDWKSCVFNDYN